VKIWKFICDVLTGRIGLFSDGTEEALDAAAARQSVTHEDLRAVVIDMIGDYQPWGDKPREEGEIWHPDCSVGCKFFLPVQGKLGMDWGVCANPKSHRCGLLTFEHQGCPQFETEKEDV
jgi:hypothetical protein